MNKTIEINWWDLEGNVQLREVPVALVEVHNGELIAAIEWCELYGAYEDDDPDPPTFIPYSVRLGVKGRTGCWFSPKEAIEGFVADWERSGATLDDRLSAPSMLLEKNRVLLPVRGTVRNDPYQTIEASK